MFTATHPRKLFWTLLGSFFLLELVVFAGGGVWLSSKLNSPNARVSLLLFLVGGGLVMSAVLAAIWVLLDKLLVSPIHLLARNAEVMAHANPLRQPELPDLHLLGELPSAMAEVGKKLHGARNEIIEAVESGRAQAELKQLRLEGVLHDLSIGVVVCDAQGRILLRNPAADRILGGETKQDLGSSVYQLFSRESIEQCLHMLELVRQRDAESEQAIAYEFVCAVVGDSRLLNCHITPLTNPHIPDAGFVLAFNEGTKAYEVRRRRDSLYRRLLEEFRGPLGSLRAAAENLQANVSMDMKTRDAFQKVLVHECEHLSEHLRRTEQEERRLAASLWSMNDIYSADLAGTVNRRLSALDCLGIDEVGDPLWLFADGHALVEVLAVLCRNTRIATDCKRITMAAVTDGRRVYLDLQWQGRPVADSTISGWINQELDSVAGTPSLGEFIEAHDGSLWCQSGERAGEAVLRLPLPVSRGQWGSPRKPLAARPEFYDFDISNAFPERETEDGSRLADLEYVVFDTETTGLKPSDGDQIVSIAGLRLAGGRILREGRFECLVQPGVTIPRSSIRFHGITDDMVKAQPRLDEVLPRFHEYVGDAVLVGHNAAFDMKFIRMKENDCDLHFMNPVLDTLLLSAFLHREEQNHTLDAIAARLGADVSGRHTASGDAQVTAAIFQVQLRLLESRGITTLAQALRASSEMVEIRRRQMEF